MQFKASLKVYLTFHQNKQETSETLQSGMPDFYIPGAAYQPDKINISQLSRTAYIPIFK